MSELALVFSPCPVLFGDYHKVCKRVVRGCAEIAKVLFRGEALPSYLASSRGGRGSSIALLLRPVHYRNRQRSRVNVNINSINSYYLQNCLQGMLRFGVNGCCAAGAAGVRAWREVSGMGR